VARPSLIETCQMVAAEGYGDYGETQTFIDGAEQQIFEIARVREQREPATALAVMTEVVENVARAHEGPGGITGAPSGFALIDERTGGMHPGELIVVAARPGMGKTAYVMTVAQNLAEVPAMRDERGALVRDAKGKAIAGGYVVVVFSLEMPKVQLGMRMTCASSGLSFQSARKGRLGTSYGAFLQHAEYLKNLPIIIDDTAAVGVLEMRSKLRRIARQHPDRKLVVIVDYLQLMSWLQGITSREEGVATNSQSLKALAKEFEAVVIALSQLNRGPEQRPDKRPQLSDLRESGAIEQDADVVQFISRPEYYCKKNDVPKELVGLAEIDTAKQRNGPTGIDEIAFRGATMRFENATDDDFERWGLERETQVTQPKMFAPGSSLPGASPRN
jgi:replicative DNA helicase